jgi:hypothetical protein
MIDLSFHIRTSRPLKGLRKSKKETEELIRLEDLMAKRQKDYATSMEAQENFAE